MTLSISCIGALYASMGGRMYSGEPVTQLASERTPHWAHFEAILGRVASSN